MRTIIIDGSPQAGGSGYENYLANLSSLLQASGHEVETFTLRDMRLSHCIGCYACWLKTPSLCALQDDMPRILAAFVQADLVVYTSPIIMGFYSALLKTVVERLLPLAHPHIGVVKGRCQHLSRYDRYPALGLLLEKGAAETGADVEVIERIFRSHVTRRQLFTKLMGNTPVEEIAHAVNGL